MILIMLLMGTASVQSDLSDQWTPQTCGLNCLFIVASAFDGEVQLHEVEANLGPVPEAGYSILQLQQGAELLGLNTSAVHTSIENLRLRRKPFACIALTESEHFLILMSVIDGRIQIIDPPNARVLKEDELLSIWTGKALLLSTQTIESEWWLRWRTITRNVLLGLVFVVVVVITYRRITQTPS